MMFKMFTPLILVIFCCTGGLFAQDGQLDSTFAGDGILLADFAEGTETINDIVQQPDEKLVAVMSSRYPNPETFDIQVVRFNPDGTNDSTFADNGVFRYRNDSGSDLGYDLELLDDGSFLVAGSWATPDPADTDFHLFKLTPQGELDSAFGTNGSTVMKIDSSEDYARAIAVTNSGEIYLGGDSKVPGFSRSRNVIMKLNAAGLVDSTFGTNGVFMWNDHLEGAATSSLRQLLITPEGDLLTSGRTKPSGTDRISLYKVKPDGSGLDSSFAVNGELLSPLQGYGYGLTMHPNGTILVTGQNLTTDGNDLVVAAFDGNGVSVPDFGVFGVVTVNPGINEAGLDIAIQPDGMIVVCGETGGTVFSGPPRQFLSVRMDITGVIDSTWGDNGIVTTMTSDFFAFPNAILVQSDGKIVLGGASATQTTGNDLTLVRYGNFIDADGDGYSIVDDCDDFVFEINPGAFDIANNGIDEDCNGEDSPVAVRFVDLSSSFEAYPNPALDEVVLRTNDPSLQALQIEVFTANGRLLSSFAPAFGPLNTTVSLRDFPAGMLVIRVQTETGTAVKRIVKL
ncbi:T9SS type A sorting domain-containing protein [Neolewinella aurantiaca]|uniref:T9SS type A sorting domain-containing protein n=1 Tax=Neolewinella aurantiaca TaxID=2602767 RepID=A0A5C7FWU4_9BACT|nr:T9SS type A sorting domain-containing protein [Neolewinella aurantiaca]TXF91174.1 T9SS type A sorting domain-containing protein [Neolewinella aurantiaca]